MTFIYFSVLSIFGPLLSIIKYCGFGSYYNLQTIQFKLHPFEYFLANRTHNIIVIILYFCLVTFFESNIFLHFFQ